MKRAHSEGSGVVCCVCFLGGSRRLKCTSGGRKCAIVYDGIADRKTLQRSPLCTSSIRGAHTKRGGFVGVQSSGYDNRRMLVQAVDDTSGEDPRDPRCRVYVLASAMESCMFGRLSPMQVQLSQMENACAQIQINFIAPICGAG